jgi:imidazole glycerol-phosphate synthase subunit HisH
MTLRVMIVDYGAGNLNSVKRSLDILGVASTVSSDPKDIEVAEKIILPGVGHFGRAMSNLRQLNLLDPLHQAVLIKRKPILGICLGMELMAEKSEEGDARGLGWVDAEVVGFNISDKKRYKVPHMGWNRICSKKNSSLMKNVDESSEFYFVHSYYLSIRNQSDLLSETKYEILFPSAIEKDNVFGVQFHPEKSHDVGTQLLKNFIEM